MCLTSNGVTYKRHLFIDGRCKRCETTQIKHIRAAVNRRAKRRSQFKKKV